jgi:hypothetical protein
MKMLKPYNEEHEQQLSAFLGLSEKDKRRYAALVVCVTLDLPWPVVGEAPRFQSAKGCGFGAARAVWIG